MDSNRFWLCDRLDVDGYFTPEYLSGVEDYLKFAISSQWFVSGDRVKCPCVKCEKQSFLDHDVVRRHLYYNGFCKNPTSITNEKIYEQPSHITPDTSDSAMLQDEHENPYVSMVKDVFRPNMDIDSSYDSEQLSEELKSFSIPASFSSLLDDANEPLWNGCKKQTILSCVSQLLNCKSEFNMSESCFNRMISIMKSSLPEDNKLSENYYQMKKKMRAFGLHYVKIHACVKNCMLFYKEHEGLQHCKECGHARYKPRNTRAKKSTQVPYNVLRYFPLTPRLQRLFMSRKIAKNMVWHAHNQSPTGVLLHPSDGEAWKNFNDIHKSFAAEIRNVRLGLCTDGFSPFKQRGRPYSCWPVMIVIYNLPPWMCMKQPYILLNMVIPGPNSPSQNIDIFLRPLIDELKHLWDVGLRTYDASKNQYFTLRAALMWTISDFPAYGMLSGWSTHGRLSCPCCMGRSNSFILQHGRKPCYFDCHRQFLPLDHSYRSQRDKFMKRVVHDLPIRRLSGEEVLNEIDSIPDIPFGEKCLPKKPYGFGLTHHWVKKSILWELPYWKTNLIRHNLDAMHVEKNCFDNVFNTVMDVKGKTKDNMKARLDIGVYCRRPNLHLVEQNGKLFKPVASYVLKKSDRLRLCAWAKDLKLPDGFASNIGRCVNLVEGRFYGMKSHDCHIFMQRLLPIALRDLVHNQIWNAITEFSHFFRDICSSELSVYHMEFLEKSIVETLCKLEKIFPPGFFDSMEHLCIHLPYEAKVGGPVQYRWMYPFERFLHHLKKKIKNTACVEGSICEAYFIEEISCFCALYFEEEVETQFSQVPRNDDGGEMDDLGHLSIFKHLGRSIGPKRKNSRYLSNDEFIACELYVLKNCEEMTPYIEMFDSMVKHVTPHIREGELEKVRDTTFPRWLKEYVSNNSSEVDHKISQLAHGPSRLAICHKGYYVNGFKFHTKEYGRSRATMNCGVCVTGSCYNDNAHDFYGVIEEIIELEYFGVGNRVVLFKCRWFDTTKGIRVDPQHGLVEVNYKSVLSSNEPFVLANQCQQVYYSPYPTTSKNRQDWWAVFKTKARSRYNLETMRTKEDLEFNGVYQEDGLKTQTCSEIRDGIDDFQLGNQGELEELNEEQIREVNEITHENDTEIEYEDDSSKDELECEEELYEGDESEEELYEDDESEGVDESSKESEEENVDEDDSEEDA